MRRAVVVGIDHYEVYKDLALCVRDAEAIAGVLGMQEFGFDVRVLLNEDASRKGIMDALSWLREDGVEFGVLHLSGHGDSTDHGAFYISADGTPGDEGVDLASLVRLSGAGPGKMRMLLLDFCHSGAISGTRGVTPSQSFSRAAFDAAFARIPAASTAVIAACASDQYAYEYPELEHGKLTYHLLEGLTGSAARDGIVTAHGLYDYVCRGFTDDANQQPAWRGDVEGNLVIGDGFTSAVLQASLRPDAIRSLEEEARTHLNDYHARWASPVSEWHREGWRAAAGALKDLLRWFERQLATYPELSTSESFIQCFGAAKGRLSQLANVDAGTVTNRGEITRVIGSGAFGSVWCVEEKDTRRSLAYKIYHPGDLDLADKRSRFERGFRAMDRLSHRNIVRVHELTEAPFGFYMDYVEGPNLRRLGPAATLDAEGQIELLLTVGEAIAYAHEMGVIHRDIKPENIVVGWDDGKGWIPFLTDFDLAWFSTATKFTNEGFGAQFYSAPEQFARPTSKEARSKTVDVYAFGQLLYFVLVGSDPTPLGLSDNGKVLREHLARWNFGAAAVQMVECFEKCTASDPSDRLPDFRPVLSMLGTALSSVRGTGALADLNAFADELRYMLGGLDAPSGVDPFSSKAGRSNLSISRMRVGGDGAVKFDLAITRMTRPLMEGAQDYAAAQVSLSKRIDAALRGFDRSSVRRVSGDGRGRVTLRIENMELSRAGVAAAYALIVPALQAFESA